MVGAGQSGLAIGVGLLRAQVDNILLVDRAEPGAEGPWLSYARMRTLRSPKDYTGPDLDLPSLGYQSWHEARYGPAHWQALDLIAREDWAAYLAWVRTTVGVPVQNCSSVVDIAPAGDLLAATFSDGKVRHTRKLVLATGQDGMGEWWMPPFVAALPPQFRAHAADPIDFAALRGRRVAVLGAGASALDNAAMALEAGAADVAIYCRRPEPQVVQPYRWLTFAGFLRHLADLPDEWRWRFMTRILGMREGFPQPTWDRCARHLAFRLVTGAPWTSARVLDGAVELTTPNGTANADFLICGTGVEMDFARRPELRHIAADIARWSDRYTPPPDERDDRLGRFPYLAADFSLIPRTPGKADWIRDVPRLQHRLDDELRPIRLLHQRHDHRGAKTGRRPDPRPLHRRHRPPLAQPASLRHPANPPLSPPPRPQSLAIATVHLIRTAAADAPLSVFDLRHPPGPGENQ